MYRGFLKRYFANRPVLGPLLGDALQFMRQGAAAVDVARDLLKTRRATKFLRDMPSPGRSRRVLVLSVNDDSIYRLKLEAMLATGLKMAGWLPVVVFDSRMRSQGKRYFQAFGIRDFVYLHDVPFSREEKRHCQESALALASTGKDLRSIKEWRFRGSWLGPQVISTLSRVQYEGMPDFSNPEVRRIVGALLPTMLENVVRAHRLLETQQPSLALVNEANYAVHGPLVDVCAAKCVDVIQFIQPWQDDSLLFWRITERTRRNHPGTVAKVTLDALVQRRWTERHEEALAQIFADRYSGKWFLQARNQVNTRDRTRAQLVAELGLDPRKKIAAVFSHVLWDGNLFYGDDLFGDNGEWFIETVRAACANDRLTWLIKLHPANVWKRSYEQVTNEYAELKLIQQKIGTLPPHVKILPADTDVSTYSLFQAIDYGVTVRGTVGMELPCFGVPCLTAGTGRYAGLGFTVDSSEADEYRLKLANLHSLEPLLHEQVMRAKWHAYAAFLLRPWTMKSVQSEFAYRKRGRHPLDHNLSLNVSSVSSLREREDLSKFGQWAMGNSCDYIDQTLLGSVGHRPELAVEAGSNRVSGGT